MSHRLEKHVLKQKDFMEKMLNIENELIETVLNTFKRMKDVFYFGNLEERNQIIAQEIFVKRTNNLTGKEAGQFMRRLEEGNEFIEKNETGILKEFEKNNQHLID